MRLRTIRNVLLASTLSLIPSVILAVGLPAAGLPPGRQRAGRGSEPRDRFKPGLRDRHH